MPENYNFPDVEKEQEEKIEQRSLFEDQEGITPTECYILDALLQKLINYDDMATMHISAIARDLKKAMDEG